MSSALTQPRLLDSADRPAVNPWLITVTVMLGTFMEVLDTSVANVALPHIAGSLSASTDESTWVLTSYLVSNAIVLPMTGWLGRVFGRKNFLLFCICLFTFSSFLCGAATSLPMLIIARILQGAGGGALQPIAQAILLESFPLHKRGQAMAAYTMGIIFAPIIGPTVGGYITDNYSWRWVFYINIPVGIIAALMIMSFIHDPPHIRNSKPGRIDLWGFGFLAIWLATFQIVLDKGQEEDWFGTPWIVWFSVISAVAFIAFIIRELMIDEPLVNLKVFRNRNFATGVLLVTIVGIVLYGTVSLVPMFLQGSLGYTAMQSGLTSSPRGFGSLIAILIVSRLVGLIDTRILITSGLLLLAYSCLLLGQISLDVSSMNVTWSLIVGGAAVSLMFVPLSVTTTATLKIEEMGNATGLYNLMRNLGGSIGISMVTTLVTRQAQTHQAVLVTHMTPYDAPFRQQLSALSQHMPTSQAYGVLYGTLVSQSAVWGYISVFRLLAILCVLAIPFVMLFKKAHTRKGPVDVH